MNNMDEIEAGHSVELCSKYNNSDTPTRDAPQHLIIPTHRPMMLHHLQ
jgi:hypothetical protein